MIPDFVGDEDYDDGMDASKIKNLMIESLINSKSFLSEEYEAQPGVMRKIGSALAKHQQAFDEVTTHKLSPQNYEAMMHECYTPFWAQEL